MPIISLTQSITKLTTVVDALGKDMDIMTRKNSESHGRLWDKNSEQYKRLDDHDKRITVIERQ